jgi:hypothetical protein
MTTTFFGITKNNAISSSIFGHIDFLGKGATTPLEDVGAWRRHRVPLCSHKYSDFFLADSICPPNPARFLGHELFPLLGRLAGPSGHVARSSENLRQLHRKQFHSKGHRVLRQFYELRNRAREQHGHSEISRLVFLTTSPPLLVPPGSLIPPTHSSRGLRFPSGPNRVLYPNNAPHALCLRPRSTRPNGQLGPTPQTSPLLLHNPSTR